MKDSYIAAKERWAQKMAGNATPAARSNDRLPPGQVAALGRVPLEQLVLEGDQGARVDLRSHEHCLRYRVSVPTRRAPRIEERGERSDHSVPVLEGQAASTAGRWTA